MENKELTDRELSKVFLGQIDLNDYQRPPLETTIYVATQNIVPVEEGRRTYFRSGLITTGGSKPRPSISSTRIFNFGIRGYTDQQGVADFLLSDVCRFSDMEFLDPISITATSNKVPAIMTAEYSRLQEDIRLNVKSFDFNGNPNPTVKFSLVGRVPFWFPPS